MTPGLVEPTLEYTHGESDKAEEEAAIQEDVGQVLDDVETEEMVEKETSKRAEESFVRNVSTFSASKSREEEQVAKQAEVRVGGVEYLAEGRVGVLDNLHMVEEVVDMDTAAEEEDLESEAEASEQDEDEECEAEEGATSDQDHFEDDQDEEDENVDEVEEEDGARRVVDIEQAEREMPPPGEHRFLPDSTARRAMRSAFSTFDKSNCFWSNVT